MFSQRRIFQIPQFATNPNLNIFVQIDFRCLEQDTFFLRIANKLFYTFSGRS